MFKFKMIGIYSNSWKAGSVLHRGLGVGVRVLDILTTVQRLLSVCSHAVRLVRPESPLEGAGLFPAGYDERKLVRHRKLAKLFLLVLNRLSLQQRPCTLVELTPTEKAENGFESGSNVLP